MPDAEPTAAEPFDTKLALILAMAMLVVVVDTSIMNVSISALVRDLDTTVTTIQSAIALYALVMAAFMLTGGKLGDLIGRNRAYTIGLVGRLGTRIEPRTILLVGLTLVVTGLALEMAAVPDAARGLDFFVPLLVIGSGVGCLISQLNNLTPSSVDEERVGEAAGVNSTAGQFGLSLGTALTGALMLAILTASFNSLADESTVLTDAQKEEVATALEQDAEVLSNDQLAELLQGQPPQTADEILSINAAPRGSLHLSRPGGRA